MKGKGENNGTKNKKRESKQKISDESVGPNPNILIIKCN